VRAALHAGAIDGEHLDVVVEVFKHLPDWATVEDRELVETTLAADARETHPNAVRRLGEQIIARLDQDGPAPKVEAEQAEPKNSLRYRRTASGRFIATLDIEQEAGEQIEDMLTVLGAPKPDDQRSHAQRLGDAFTEIIQVAAGASDMPSKKPHLSIHVDYNFLLEGIGTATLDGGSFLCAEAARRVACDAEVIPIVFKGESVPIDVGRNRRLITDHQRHVLIARDKGCAFPHCDRPPRWCDGHHVQHWLQGGRTDVGNLVLLCKKHHRLIHHSKWEVRITNGIPEFLPPPWLDPARTPLRNTLRQ
jgi:hypothetical protein